MESLGDDFVRWVNGCVGERGCYGFFVFGGVGRIFELEVFL